MVGRFDTGTRARARAAMRRMVDSAEGPRLSAPGRRVGPGRIVHALARFAELAAVFALVGAIALAVRLANGPIYLEALHDKIASSLQERAGDRYTIELGPTYIMHDSWGVGLGFRRLIVRDAGGRRVLSAPTGKIGLDPFALFLTQVKVRRLELDGLLMRLRVAEDGALSIAVSGDIGATPIVLPSSTTSGAESPNLAALIRAGAEAMAGAGQAIDRLTLANGQFEIDNEATRRSVSFRDFDLVFDRSGDEAKARISATGPAGPWTIEAQAAVGNAPTLAVQARDVSLADIEAFNKKPPPLFAEGPIAFRFDARLAPDETIQSLTGRFTVGAGKVRLNNPDALPFLVDEASGRINWDYEQKRLRIDELMILAGETHVNADGWVSPPADAAGAWTGRLESKDTRFGPERHGGTPVVLDSIVADARFLPSESRFVLNWLTVRGPTVEAALKADIAPDGPGVSLKLGIEIKPSVTPDVMRLWPQFINPDVRDWCSHNLHGGQIQGTMLANWSAADLEAMDKKRAVSRESVHGSFSSHDVGVDLMPGLPMMVSGEGSGQFTGRDFTVSADHAAMTLSPTRRIQADNLTFTVPDTTPRAIVDAQARAHLTGTADALADLLGREPLRKQAGLQIDPATVKGQAEGDLVLDLKLGKTAKPDDTQFHATGALSNLTLDKLIGEEKFEQASVTFEADRNTLKMAGDGQLFGAATHVDVGRAAGDEGSATLTLTLDAAARAKRGLNLGWLTGPLPIKLKAPLSRASADVEMDLTPAGVDNPVPGVAKAAGKPGKATFQVKPAPEGGASLTNIAVDFGTALARGSADAAADGSILAVRLTQARISAGDDFKVDIVNTLNVVKATVRGSTLDARPFIRSLTASGSSSQPGGRDFDIDMKVASVIGANKQSINGLEFNLSRRGGEDRIALLRGRIGQGSVVANGAPGGSLRLASGDAGALMRFADLYSRMEGGNLDLTLSASGDSSEGKATVANFLLRDEPAFRRLVAAGETQAPGAEVDPSAVRFQKMTMAFERSPGVLDITDAVIYNANMGLTTEGRVNFARSEIDVSGTFVPAYSVNSVLNKIPLVGVLLGGGQNEGVIGISYRLRGPLSGPQLTINPLSAIAPGILRKIIGAVDGTAGRGSFAPGDATVATPVQR
ncbi:MAG: AsmA-like C-terminal domain-containing protein [Hyphomicrobiales bacterium]|nr:AsmA-like C-terminal domain-containing protein [Hyphomicrobiales bacterium]